MLLCLPDGLVVRIRRSHRRGPGSIPGQGTQLMHLLLLIVRGLLVEATMPLTPSQDNWANTCLHLGISVGSVAMDLWELLDAVHRTPSGRLSCAGRV